MSRENVEIGGKKNEHYFTKRFILFEIIFDKNTPREQIYGLIYTASAKQVLAIIEIIHNALSGSIPLSKKIQSIVNRHKKVLINFTNSKKPVKTKLRASKKHYRLLSRILGEVREFVIKLLK